MLLKKTKFVMPESKLELQLTLGNAKQFFLATNKMIEAFRKSVPQDEAFDLFQDGWSGTVTLAG